MNSASSRSHCAIFVTIQCENKKTGSITSGKLVMVDLAGSERIDKSGAVGAVKDEANNINLSLTALGKVISALQVKQKDKNRYIPYRDSKLTMLLQDCLGGNSKCLMFCNLSPATSNQSESLCTLRFAARARDVQLGKAKKNSSGAPAPPPAPNGGNAGGNPNGGLSAGVQNVALQATNSQLMTDVRQKEKENTLLKAQLKRSEDEENLAKQRVAQLEAQLAQLQAQMAHTQTGVGMNHLNTSMARSGSKVGTPVSQRRTGPGQSRVGTPTSSQHNHNHDMSMSLNGMNVLNGSHISGLEFNNSIPLNSSIIQTLTADGSCSEQDVIAAARRMSMKRRLDDTFAGNNAGNASKIPNRARTPGKSATHPTNAGSNGSAYSTIPSSSRSVVNPNNNVNNAAASALARRQLLSSSAASNRASISNPRATAAAAAAALANNGKSSGLALADRKLSMSGRNIGIPSRVGKK